MIECRGISVDIRIFLHISQKSKRANSHLAKNEMDVIAFTIHIVVHLRKITSI